MCLCSVFVFVFVFLFYICTAHGREKGENYTDLTSSILLSSRSRWSSFYICICIIWFSCPDFCNILSTTDIIRFRLPQVSSPIFSWPKIMFSKCIYAYISFNQYCWIQLCHMKARGMNSKNCGCAIVEMKNMHCNWSHAPSHKTVSVRPDRLPGIRKRQHACWRESLLSDETLPKVPGIDR